jgi:hypothetical protein
MLTTHPHLVPRLRMSSSSTSFPPSAFMACSMTPLSFHCLIIPHCFCSIWQIQNIWSVVNLLPWNPHWSSKIISWIYRVTLREECWINVLIGPQLITVIFLEITTVSFIALFISRHNNRFLTLVVQCFHIPNRTEKFVDLGTNANLLLGLILSEFFQYFAMYTFSTLK